MTGETRRCQNCRTQFTVEPKDFAFYEMMQVPAPTWCPSCRLERRLMFMNERNFYKAKCSLCSREMISIFPQEAHKRIYCSPCWWSDKWDPMSYGRDYDFSRSFFEQFRDLYKEFPEMGRQMMETTVLNSDYTNICSYLKNCYLLFQSDYDEDCAYGDEVERSKRSYNLYMVDLCELCYEGANLFKCFKCFFSINCNECVEVHFSKKLIGCSYCFGCVNLRNKKYYIFNKPYSKEDYFKEIAKFDLGSFKKVEALRTKMAKEFLRYPKKYLEGLKNVNVSGNYIFNSKNVLNSYEVGMAEDCKFCQMLFIGPIKDAYDFSMWGGGATRIYECMGAGGGQNNFRFSFCCWTNAADVQYSWYMLAGGSSLFGCIGLRNKQYCILNKQYSKEEYERLVPKIIQQMKEMPYVDKKGRTYKYGEFFPPEMAPFAYNETIAQDYFPLTKAIALERGYLWRDSEKKDYKITLPTENIPDHIKDVSDSVVKEVIGCAHGGRCGHRCTLAFKIIPQELKFLREMNLPLPRLCPNCRYYEKIQGRNMIALYERQCDCAGKNSVNKRYDNLGEHFHGLNKCPNEFETPYASERPEIVYCEQCYNAEVA